MKWSRSVKNWYVFIEKLSLIPKKPFSDGFITLSWLYWRIPHYYQEKATDLGIDLSNIINLGVCEYDFVKF